MEHWATASLVPAGLPEASSRSGGEPSQTPKGSAVLSPAGGRSPNFPAAMAIQSATGIPPLFAREHDEMHQIWVH
jgi:hypothetical protein